MDKPLSDLDLPVSALTGLPPDKQLVELCAWLSQLVAHLRDLESVDNDAATFVVAEIEKLYDYIQKAPKDQPIPVTKPLRDLVGALFALVYAPDNARGVYETANKQLSIVNSGKVDKYSDMKHMAVVALKAIFDTAGERISSLAPLAAISIIKHIKGSVPHNGFKISLLDALRAVCSSSGDAFDDSLAKDTWKLFRTLATDKSSRIAALSYSVLEALASVRIVFRSSSDFDTFKSLYYKSLDSAHPIVRQSAAKCFATVLLQCFGLADFKIEGPGALARKRTTSKRAASANSSTGSGKNKDGDDDDDNAEESPQVSKGKSASFYSLTLSQILELFTSSYLQAHSSPRVRTGVTQTIAFFLLSADRGIIENNYQRIASCLLNSVINYTLFKSTKFQVLALRQDVVFLLTDIIAVEALGEYGQIAALKSLCSDILSNQPQTDPQGSGTTKETLVATLQTCTNLINFLGSAVASSVDVVRPPLLSLLEHTSYSVRMAACVALKALVNALPSLLIPSLTSSLNHINSEVALLSKQESQAHKIIGHAYFASVLLSLTVSKSQYSSLDLASRALATAISLLKSTGSMEVLVVQIQSAWLLLCGLMPLGPNFVKVHLSQLLLLWKSALYKPPTKDGHDKSTIELSYHLHVRYYAISSVVMFLKYNSKLVTSDVARRIGVMLQNTMAFLSSIPSRKIMNDDPSKQIDKSLSIYDYHMMVNQRVLQAYLLFSHYQHAIDLFPANLLTSTFTCFADPQIRSPKLGTAIAASSGAIDSVWEINDNIAFGLTSRVQGYDILNLSDNLAESRKKDSEMFEDQQKHWLSDTDWVDQLERNIQKPILPSTEFDFQSIFSDDNRSMPVSAPTQVVDYAIELFAVLLPTQTHKVQESILDQVRGHVRSAPAAGQKNTEKRTATFINCLSTVHASLKYALSFGKDSLKSTRNLAILLDIAKTALGNQDPYVRNIGAQTMGMLCALGGSSVIAENVKYLIDEIVANRDPNARAGCSVSLGYILKYVGSMFAGLHLKTVLGILMSLANDPHPVVHFWALEAISITISSTGLSFTNFASTTLSTLAKLYSQESHGLEIASTASSNLNEGLDTSRIIARCLRALINVLGPDLRESDKMRDGVLHLLEQLSILGVSSPGVKIEVQRSNQELLLFAPGSVNLKAFSKEVRNNLLDMKVDSPLQKAAVDGLYQLIRTESLRVLEYTGQSLTTDIWLAYNQSPRDGELRRFIENLLEQSGEQFPLQWVTRIQSVQLKPQRFFEQSSSKGIKFAQQKSGSTDASKGADVDLGDEEGASFASKGGGDDQESGQGSGEGSSGTQMDEPLKWQTRALSVSLLRRLLEIMIKGKTIKQKEASPLAGKIGDIIKIAFSASTASVSELRLLGLQLLDDVISGFKDLADPDFREVALLEQYQAQISSALTPAFSSDSSPELALQAIRVCATFIGSGISERMDRILRILTNALESCSSNASSITLGSLQVASPNAQVMLRVAILSLWAELQVSSVQNGKEYLEDIVSPYIPTLVPLWISSLREFAKLRFEPEQTSNFNTSMSSLSGSIEQMYSALKRTSVLPIYMESWLQQVDAIASLIEKDRKLVFNILDEKERESDDTEGIRYSNEPAAFFFVLFGLCFEALVRPSHGAYENRLKVLMALQRILHPSVSGTAIYEEIVFAETIDVLDRIILTGSLEEQKVIVSIVAEMCINHPGSANNHALGTDKSSAESDQITESVDQLFELFRVVMLCLTNIFPFLANSEQRPKLINENPTMLTLIRTCLGSLVSMIESFPNIIKVDLYACLLYVFGLLLEEPQCQKSVVSYSLVVEKKLLQSMMKTRSAYQSEDKAIDRAIITAMSHIVGLLKSADTNEEGLMRRKNCLLSSVVLITTCASVFNEEDWFLHELGNLMIENISIPELTQVTSDCLRGVLVSCSGTIVGKVITENTVPSLISMANNGDSGKPSVAKPVNDIMVAFVKSLTDKQNAIHGLSIVLPTLIQFIGDRSSPIPPDQRVTYSREKFIELATFNGEAFKEVVQKGLSQWQRTLLEKVLRGEEQDTERPVTSNDDDSEPQIQLKSFA